MTTANPLTECEVDGVRYVAKDDATDDCAGCSATHLDLLCSILPICGANERPDRRSVIWVRAEQEARHG